MRKNFIAAAPIAIWVWASCCASARADGGTVAFRGKAGPYAVTVFTAPTPVRAGPVDVSVLVQDPQGEPVPQAQVNVALAPRGGRGPSIHVMATTDAATNKLLRSALFELPRPGRWDVDVAITAGKNAAHTHFPLEVLEPALVGIALSWWDTWPVLAIALYTFHQWLVGRAGRTKGNGEPCSHRPRNWA